MPTPFVFVALGALFVGLGTLRRSATRRSGNLQQVIHTSVVEGKSSPLWEPIFALLGTDLRPSGNRSSPLWELNDKANYVICYNLQLVK